MHLYYTFVTSSANATVGATYTNNSQTFTVLATVSSSVSVTTIGTGAPDPSGTLVLASGTGDATISFSGVNIVLPDNRLRFQAPLINFASEVGLCGQDHENFPAADVQPRWDWLLLWYISLLANQSSYDEPTQYRDGTLWFDLNTLTLKIWRSSLGNISGSWMTLASSIELETVGGVPITLSNWYTSASNKLSGSAPEITFSGTSETMGVTEIPVPVSLQGEIDVAKTRPFLYKNGLLIDPRNCEYYTSATIRLNAVTLDAGDKFTVVIKNILPANFYLPDVLV